MAYLFFLAIHHVLRSKGYGSLSIKTLKSKYPKKKLVVDFEMLDDHADNSEQRKKRRNFYLQNGYKETGFFVSYMGVDYEVFCTDDDFDPDDFKEMMKTIQVDGFDPTYFYKKIKPKPDYPLKTLYPRAFQTGQNHLIYYDFTTVE